MRTDLADDDIVYKVVVNEEGQYSVWPAQRVNPLGWQDVGTSGTRAACLAYISLVWTDMRPRSVRMQLMASQQQEVPQQGQSG